jgi:MFS superfamily sulfate permease-like transporter
MNPSTNTRLNEILSALRGDFLPSITVFLVALPLCMGIAIASGAPVAAGLITGIVGGLIVGLIAGAPLQVSGPAAGLTVVVYGIIQQYGFEAFGVVLLLGGLIQLTAGALRLGQWFRAVSPAVIHGMLAGIGILIFVSQFHVMVDDAPKDSGLENLMTIPQAVAKGLPLPESTTAEKRQTNARQLKKAESLHQRQLANADAARRKLRQLAEGEAAGPPERLIAEQELIAAELRILTDSIRQGDSTSVDSATVEEATAARAASDAALAALERQQAETWAETQTAVEESLQRLKLSLRNHQWAAKIGLLTIVVLVGWQVFRPKRLQFLPAPLLAVSLATAVTAFWHLPIVCLEVPDNLASAIHLPDLSLVESIPLMGLIQSAFVVAMIASAETLLCATAIDQMHNGKRTNYDRELMAQGIGNSICGLLGALPMTGVIVRSSTNVQAGARTRCSAILHGAWLLVFVVLLGSLLRYIPVASLAAVLVYVGYRLVNVNAVKELGKYGRGEIIIYLATVIGVVAIDLLTGVMIGIGLSAIKLLYVFSHLRTTTEMEPGSNRVVLSLEGAATFLRLPLLASKLEQVPPSAELHVDFERLEYIDHACLDLLMNWAKQHEATGGSLVLDWDSLHANFHRERAARQRSVA